MDYYYNLDTSNSTSMMGFQIVNNRVLFKKYAFVDNDLNVLASFFNKEQADRVSRNSMYNNAILIELEVPDDIILSCIKTRMFDLPGDVISFINGGYKECAEYKVNHIEKELSGDNVDTSVLSLKDYKEYKQELNKKELAKYLETHPLLWTDEKYYGVTQEDQIEMQSDLTAYNLKQSMGDTDWKLEWHDKSKSCREFTTDEFYQLMNAIIDFVYPLRRKQESFKEQIFKAESKEELDNLIISYEDEVNNDNITE